MKPRREEKAGAADLEHFALLLRGCLDLDAKRLENIRAPTARSDTAVAVLDHPRTGSRGNEHDRGGNIEKPELVAASAADVEDTTDSRRNIKWNSGAKKLRGESPDLGGRLPAAIERIEKIGFVFVGKIGGQQRGSRCCNLF
jgi:hypothetical protein